jgi:hypothetical protein
VRKLMWRIRSAFRHMRETWLCARWWWRYVPPLPPSRRNRILKYGLEANSLRNTQIECQLHITSHSQEVGWSSQC